ncbi:hypothetical protein FRC01_000677 [Tulasnella sp. 417]|nr:hypothetical protein FRC01_000677 [Tulasnella sp. 417]
MEAAVQRDQGAALLSHVNAMRKVALWICLVSLATLPVTYFLYDSILKPLGYVVHSVGHVVHGVGHVVHNVGDTIGAVNNILQVAGTSLDGARITTGSALSHVADLWCKMVDGPTCSIRQGVKPSQSLESLSRVPLAHTEEMIYALKRLSELSVEIDFQKMVHSFSTNVLSSKWNLTIQEEWNAEAEVAVEDWNNLVLFKTSAVASVTAMIQHVRHQRPPATNLFDYQSAIAVQ